MLTRRRSEDIASARDEGRSSIAVSSIGMENKLFQCASRAVVSNRQAAAGIPRTFRLVSDDGRVVIEKGDQHPEAYLWIVIDSCRFFLAVAVPGMTMEDVKSLGNAFVITKREASRA